MSLSLFLAAVLTLPPASPVAAQENANCPEGFLFQPWSGVVCVQDPGSIPEGGRLSYTGGSICNEGSGTYEWRETTDGEPAPGTGGARAFAYLLSCEQQPASTPVPPVQVTVEPSPPTGATIAPTGAATEAPTQEPTAAAEATLASTQPAVPETTPAQADGDATGGETEGGGAPKTLLGDAYQLPGNARASIALSFTAVAASAIGGMLGGVRPPAGESGSGEGGAGGEAPVNGGPTSKAEARVNRIFDRAGRRRDEVARRMLRRMRIPGNVVNDIDNPAAAVLDIVRGITKPRELGQQLSRVVRRNPRIATNFLLRRGLKPIHLAMIDERRVVRAAERFVRNPPRALREFIRDVGRNLHPKRAARRIRNAARRVINATPPAQIFRGFRRLRLRRRRRRQARR